MKKCLVCDRSTPDNNHDLCVICNHKKINDEDDYIADRAEKELVKELIKLEDLLT